jgi:hypothetical protein
VLNELDTIINGGEGVVVLSVLSDPNGVLGISGGLFSGIEGLVGFNILDSLSEVDFGLFEGSLGVVSQFGVSCLLDDVVVDIVIQVGEDSFAGGQVSSVDLIVISLILDDSGDDGVQEHVDFVSGGLGGEVGLDSGENDVSERLGVNFCKHGLGVHEFGVVHVSVGENQKQG